MQKQSSLPPAKPKAKPWFLYLVECQNGKIYTGITVDVDRRMNEHASGTGAKFTRANPITKLLGVLEFPDRSEASQAEHAVKQLSPGTAVFVVEPEGADSLRRSFDAGSPQAIDAVRTIADSLGAPRCEPYSYELNRHFVDDVVLVNDDAIRDAMRLLFRSAKLVVEPAGAAALAALMGPLRETLAGRSVGLVVCGGNIDHATFCRHLGTQG